MESNNIKMFSNIRMNQFSVSLAPDLSPTLFKTDLTTCRAKSLCAAH